jgi:hypothetical protein
MSPRREQRTAPCGRAEAVVRQGQARKFYEVAELVEGEADTVPSSSCGRSNRVVLRPRGTSTACWT